MTPLCVRRGVFTLHPKFFRHEHQSCVEPQHSIFFGLRWLDTALRSSRRAFVTTSAFGYEHQGGVETTALHISDSFFASINIGKSASASFEVAQAASLRRASGARLGDLAKRLFVRQRICSPGLRSHRCARFAGWQPALPHFTFSYSFFAAIRIGKSASASFHNCKNVSYDCLALAESPCITNALAKPKCASG